MSTNAIKWTPGPPPEPRNENYLCFCVRNGAGLRAGWVTMVRADVKIENPDIIKAHALITIPIAIEDAVCCESANPNEVGHRVAERPWYYWDLNGTTRSTGYATREKAEAAYRDEYGDW